MCHHRILSAFLPAASLIPFWSVYGYDNARFPEVLISTDKPVFPEFVYGAVIYSPATQSGKNFSHTVTWNSFLYFPHTTVITAFPLTDECFSINSNNYP